jgi:hypothetical protein
LDYSAKNRFSFLGKESSDGAEERAETNRSEEDPEELDKGPEEGPHVQRVRIS